MAIAPFQACRQSLTPEQLREAAQAMVTSTGKATPKPLPSTKVTARDSLPAVYRYEQRQDGSSLSGFVALIEAGSMERLHCPMPASPADTVLARRFLTERQQLAPVLALYDAEPPRSLKAQFAEALGAEDDLRIDPIADPQTVLELNAAMSDKPLTVIAGQEWLETANGHPVMVLLVNLRTCAPDLDPMHRAVRWNPGWQAGDLVRLGREHFFFNDITRVLPQIDNAGPHYSSASAEEYLRPKQADEIVYLAVTAQHTFRIHSLPEWADTVLAHRTPEERAISAVQLHEILIPEGLQLPPVQASDQRVSYTDNMDEAVARVNRGDADVAFLMNAPGIEQIVAVARNGGAIPPNTFRSRIAPVPGAITYAF